jgi:hypothetical protein
MEGQRLGGRSEVGKVTLKSNGDEALNNEFRFISIGDEAYGNEAYGNEAYGNEAYGNEAFNAEKKIAAMKE